MKTSRTNQRSPITRSAYAIRAQPPSDEVFDTDNTHVQSVCGPATIEQAGKAMRDGRMNALYVRDGARISVVTGMNLSKAAVLRRLPLGLADVDAELSEQVTPNFWTDPRSGIPYRDTSLD
jgi:hypothetical protein